VTRDVNANAVDDEKISLVDGAEFAAHADRYQAQPVELSTARSPFEVPLDTRVHPEVPRGVAGVYTGGSGYI